MTSKVPFSSASSPSHIWALARVFGRDPMYWYRLECALGRFSVVGTTVRQGRVA